MLACRLCLAIGIDDPEAWLETVTERQLALWQAFYRLEPWGAEFHRSATQSTLTSATMSMLAAAHGQKMDVQEFATFMPSDWVDSSKETAKKKRNSKSAVKGVKTLCGMFPTADKKRIR